MQRNVWTEDDGLSISERLPADAKEDATISSRPKFAMVVGSFDDDDDEAEKSGDRWENDGEFGDQEDTNVPKEHAIRRKSSRVYSGFSEPSEEHTRSKSPASWHPRSTREKGRHTSRDNQDGRNAVERHSVLSQISLPELGAPSRHAPAPYPSRQPSTKQDEVSVFERSGGALTDKIQELADTLITSGASRPALTTVVLNPNMFLFPANLTANFLSRLLSVSDCIAHFANASCGLSSSYRVDVQESERLMAQAKMNLQRSQSQMRFMLSAKSSFANVSRLHNVVKEENDMFAAVQRLYFNAPAEMLKDVGIMDAKLEVHSKVAQSKIDNLKRSCVVETEKTKVALEEKSSEETQIRKNLCVKWQQLLASHDYFALVHNVLRATADHEACTALHEKARACLILLQMDVQHGDCQNGLQFLAETIRRVKDTVEDLKQCVANSSIRSAMTEEELRLKANENQRLSDAIAKQVHEVEGELKVLDAVNVNPESGTNWAQITLRKSELKHQLGQIQVNLKALDTARAQLNTTLKLRQVQNVFEIVDSMEKTVSDFLDLVCRTEATLQRKEFLLQLKFAMLGQIQQLKTQDIEKSRLRNQHQVVEVHSKQVAEEFGRFVTTRQNLIDTMLEKRKANLIFLEKDAIPSSLFGEFKTYFEEVCNAHDKALEAMALLIQADILTRAADSCKKILSIPSADT